MNSHDAESPDDFDYGFYFPEGGGYLWIKALGAGTEGNADLVWSCANNQTNFDKVYVRKKTRTHRFLSEWSVNDHPTGEYVRAEIEFYRNHRLIPRLIDWTSYRAAPYNNIDNTRRAYTTSMVFEYCNSGTLGRIINTYSSEMNDRIQREYRQLNAYDDQDLPGLQDARIPEAFIWKVFGQLLGIVDYLHHMMPGVYHNDLLDMNIFLHRPTAEQILPDCYLGDFGRAEVMPSYRTWNADGTRARRRYSVSESTTIDYEFAIYFVKTMMTLDHTDTLALTPFGLRINTTNVDEKFTRLQGKETGWLQTLGEQVQWQRDNRGRGPYYSPKLYDAIQTFDNDLKQARRVGTNPHFRQRALNFESHATDVLNNQTDIITVPPVDNKWRTLVADPAWYQPQEFFSGPSVFTKEAILAMRRDLPLGPWKIAKIDRTTRDVVAMSRRTYRTYSPPTWLEGPGDLRDSNDVSLPRSSRETSALNRP